MNTFDIYNLEFSFTCIINNFPLNRYSEYVRNFIGLAKYWFNFETQIIAVELALIRPNCSDENDDIHEILTMDQRFDLLMGLQQSIYYKIW